MPLQQTPPPPLTPLDTVGWEEKLREFATLFCTRHHHRSPDLWWLYVPEAEAHMRRTYTHTPDSWVLPEGEAE